MLIARDERRRQTCSPDEIREHLHARLSGTSNDDAADDEVPGTGDG